jgi:hypothetical protein
MRPGALRHALVAGVLAATCLGTGPARADDDPPAPVLDWQTGAGRSYLIPALEIPGFGFLVNQFDRAAYDSSDYDSDAHTIWKNLRTAPVYDKDPFSVNQLAHPYQGSLYYGFARSAGLNFWESTGYSLFGSFLWETAGETTPPSVNDYVTTTLGGAFFGEALFRLASHLLEGDGQPPGFWRELGAAVLSPPTGFNRLVFGERFKPAFPSRDPAVYMRLRLGATLTTQVNNAHLSTDVRRQEGSGDIFVTYGLPGKPGYQYTRPFDFFLFEFTAVPNANTVANAIENVTVRGLLTGAKYDVGDDYRSVWGLFGGYEYLSPQVFRVATTSLSLGTVLTARLIIADRAMVEASGRQYWVVGLGAGASEGAERFGHELINRASVSLTVRIYGRHALSLGYLVSTRDARFPDGGDRHQTVQTVTLSYNFLGHTRFGAVDGRPSELASH